jgi:hypothetical protein
MEPHFGKWKLHIYQNDELSLCVSKHRVMNVLPIQLHALLFSAPYLHASAAVNPEQQFLDCATMFASFIL